MQIRSIFFELFIVVLLNSWGYVHAAERPGWILHGSCDSSADLVRGAVNRAFQMATDAYDELNKPRVDELVLRLYNYLFIERAQDGTAVLDNVKQVFKAVSDMRNEIAIPNRNLNDQSQVTIYCNLDRLTEKSPSGMSIRGLLYDHDIVNWIEANDADLKAIRECRSRITRGFSQTYALTEAHINDIHATKYLNQLDICPWYIDYSFKGKFDESKTYKLKVYAYRIWLRLSGLNPWRKPIDTLHTIDVTILHELTHTSYAGRVWGENAMIDDGIGYGWNKCRSRVQEGHNNSDSYALFGSAIRVMKNQDGPHMVTEDGRLESMTGPLAKRIVRALGWLG